MLFILAMAVSQATDPNNLQSTLLILLFLAAIMSKIIYRFAGKVKVSYDFDEYGAERIKLISQVIAILQSNSAIWQVNDVFHNAQIKYYPRVHMLFSHNRQWK